MSVLLLARLARRHAQQQLRTVRLHKTRSPPWLTARVPPTALACLPPRSRADKWNACPGADVACLPQRGAEICVTIAPKKVNIIVAGTVYENVAGIYTCDFVNDKKAVATTTAMARSALPPPPLPLSLQTPPCLFARPFWLFHQRGAGMT